jgi:hypothetical protein
MIATINILSNSSFINNPTILCYIIFATDNVIRNSECMKKNAALKNNNSRYLKHINKQNKNSLKQEWYKTCQI